MSVPMISSDLKMRNADGHSFPDHLRNYAATVWLTPTKFGKLTQVR